ncbi:hypothetical protein KBY66_06835 [Synechococcus sp. Tobar12-5m-g]|nr:hypothetical protein [Synechococcus sp. Cruz CV-v-12]MCP9772339.1 hypothetical protein [Synechococcus sp. Tobar12-5m-g]MCP9873281.1 hypothetical protein [Synechococcus sp. Cruz CV-v-12]
MLSPGPIRGVSGGVPWMLVVGVTVGAVVGLPLSFLPSELDERNLLFMPLVLFGSWLVFLLVRRVERRLSQPWWILQLSAASYFLYLFHRPLFKLATSWSSSTAVVPELAYLLLACLPLIILTAWWGQRLYDAGLATIGGSR